MELPQEQWEGQGSGLQGKESRLLAAKWEHSVQGLEHQDWGLLGQRQMVSVQEFRRSV